MFSEYDPRTIAELVEADARRRHAVNPRVVEQPELIPAEAVEIVPAEIRPVEVQLLERRRRTQSRRQVRRVLRVGARRHRRSSASAGPHGFQLDRANHVPLTRDAVAAAPVLPRAAEPVASSCCRHDERLAGRAVADERIEAELILDAAPSGTACIASRG